LTEPSPELRAAIDEIRRTFRAAPRIGSSGPSFGDEAAKREVADRSWIARAIIGAFLAALAAIFGLIIARAIAPGRWDEAVTLAVELFKIGLLPVVTLVLGFYFGRSDRR
jgi:hypothetical protein